MGVEGLIAEMKKLLILLSLIFSLSAFAGDSEPDWEYVPYPFAPYSVNIPGDDDTIATLVGTACPSGLKISRELYTVGEFQVILQNLVDALVYGPTELMKSASTPSKQYNQRLRQRSHKR